MSWLIHSSLLLRYQSSAREKVTWASKIVEHCHQGQWLKNHSVQTLFLETSKLIWFEIEVQVRWGENDHLQPSAWQRCSRAIPIGPHRRNCLRNSFSLLQLGNWALLGGILVIRNTAARRGKVGLQRAWPSQILIEPLGLLMERDAWRQEESPSCVYGTLLASVTITWKNTIMEEKQRQEDVFRVDALLIK